MSLLRTASHFFACVALAAAGMAVLAVIAAASQRWPAEVATGLAVGLMLGLSRAAVDRRR